MFARKRSHQNNDDIRITFGNKKSPGPGAYNIERSSSCIKGGPKI